MADEHRSLSFRQLRDLALTVAAQLPQDTERVGVMAHRDVFTVAMLFGAAYRGISYVPLDPELPGDKLEKLLEAGGLETVLSFREEDRARLGAHMKLLSQQGQPWQGEPRSEELCVIFTSGSTGVPKGVVKHHRAMASFLEAFGREFPWDETVVLGNQTPFFFDASAKDLFVMAAYGACLEILPTGLFTFPGELMAYMNRRRVNTISWVPSALTVVSALNTFSEIKPVYLRRVFFVGEVFPVRQLNRWIRALPEVEFVNLYGSSEICGISCFYRVPGEVEEMVPLGRALSNCRVQLSAGGDPVTGPGQTGEIWVASPALAEGYLADGEKTAASFVTRDLGDGMRRWYRTGDMAQWDVRGNLVFLSRNDDQIKHMGHRIELGEITHAALQLPQIRNACCLYRKERDQLVLFVELREDTQCTGAEIRRELRSRLAGYMVPHRVNILQELPKNANGKIDRAALQKG